MSQPQPQPQPQPVSFESEAFDIPEPEYAVLQLYVEGPCEEGRTQWLNLYHEHVKAHNMHVYEHLEEANSGFDLFFPHDVMVPPATVAPCKMVPLNIKCRMFTCTNDGTQAGRRVPTAFYLMPRSSLAKTPLLLSNQMGLIDRGYRGTLQAALTTVSNEWYSFEAHTRLLQLVHPQALPILVDIVDDPAVLAESTTRRGAGGFGSTGR
jgi:dUTP pyrophosphatase